MDLAHQQKDPIERMKYVTAFFVYKLNKKIKVIRNAR